MGIERETRKRGMGGDWGGERKVGEDSRRGREKNDPHVGCVGGRGEGGGMARWESGRDELRVASNSLQVEGVRNTDGEKLSMGDGVPTV